MLEVLTTRRPPLSLKLLWESDSNSPWTFIWKTLQLAVFSKKGSIHWNQIKSEASSFFRRGPSRVSTLFASWEKSLKFTLIQFGLKSSFCVTQTSPRQLDSVQQQHLMGTTGIAGHIHIKVEIKFPFSAQTSFYPLSLSIVIFSFFLFPFPSQLFFLSPFQLFAKFLNLAFILTFLSLSQLFVCSSLSPIPPF